MLTLPHIFSTGALFLQNAPLTLHGKTDSTAAVTAAIADDNGQILSQAEAIPSHDGAFTLTLHTPKASLVRHTVTVCAGDDCHVMEDVLFGELWLASGQSNMELENKKQPDAKKMLSALSARTVRVYHVFNIGGGSSGMFPPEPADTARGAWSEHAEEISAAATAFAVTVYDHLRSVGHETPIGFVNACWGGTGIHSWLPKTAVDADPVLAERLRAAKLYSDPETWNTHGRENAQQMSCQYNLKIHCLLGLRFRAMLWYQGEFESWDEPYRRTYLDCLYLLQRTYSALFSSDGQLPMFCMLIYPFPCTDESDCYIGYVNHNFVEAAKEHPDMFHIVPTVDLPPIWSAPADHPIHPLHKYALGKRIGALALSAVYTHKGMKNPAILDRYDTVDGKMLLHFTVPGQPDALSDCGGIRVGASPSALGRILQPIGLYLCGESGVYVPAFCEILSADTLAVFHPGITDPRHAAYACSSMEEGCDLFAGDLPVAPFLTDYGDRSADADRRLIQIDGKPWCDPRRTSVWTAENTRGIFDVFYRPTWKPLQGSEVAHDRAFTLDTGSIRVALSADALTPLQRTSTVGAYVEAHPYNRLDLQNYTALHLRMLSCGPTDLSVVLTYRCENAPDSTLVIPAMQTASLDCGWAEYCVSLDGIPAGEISRMEFRADISETYYHFINIEGFVLMPR